MLAALVENKPGVLYKVANLFRRRDFNIESFSAGPTEKRDITRITVTFTGDEITKDQVIKQLKKLVDVIHVELLNPINTVQRELALIKVSVNTSAVRREIVDYTSIFRSRIVDVSPKSVVIEITGTPSKIDTFINLMVRYGIIEITRTGVTSLKRGKDSFNSANPILEE